MEKIKYLIMGGGTLILLGIIFKMIGLEGPWAGMCFGVGGTMKLLYLILGVRAGLVKIGFEIAFLIIGLALIFAAVYLRKTDQLMHLYAWFLASGVVIKVLFVVIFIRKQKRFRKELAIE